MHPSPPPGLLLLEDGGLYRGLAHSPGTAFGEVVFNTSMTGYQEILTDPSYRGQIVIMTLPHIGNYGTRGELAESSRVWAQGFVARRLTPGKPRYRSEESLIDYLRRAAVPALSGIDTRALGARTYKLEFGHHGGNQPVRDLATGRVAITSQNHGFAVDPATLPASCRVTHRNLNDGTVEGLAVDGRPIFSVQYHPEAAPGPRESRHLFDRFLDLVATTRPRPVPAGGR